jgi:MYXO-CTERM domain-containing protein
MYRRLALAIAASTLAGPALAQTTTPTPTPSGGLAPSDLLIRVQKPVGNNQWAFITTDVELARYFNGARCKCDDPIRITVDLAPASAAKRNTVNVGTYMIRIGNIDCVTANSTNFMNAKCTDLVKSGLLTSLVSQGTTVDTTVGALFRAPNITNGASCAVEFQQNIWLMVDQDPLDMLPDAAFADASAPKLSLHLDGLGPPAPTDVKVTPGNEALSLSWTKGGLVDDQNGYVVFCSRADQPVFKPSLYATDQFATQKTACFQASNTKSALTLSTNASTMAPPLVIGAPAAFQDLNPDYVCSRLITTATSWRITGLQNGIPYVVAVAAVDIRGNASVVDTALVQTPIQTVGFYDAYRAAGGEASGCSYGAGGSAGGAALALLALGLVRRRRR